MLQPSTLSLITAGLDREAVWSDGSHWEGEIVNTGCTSLKETRGFSALYSVKRPNYYINLSSGTHTRLNVAGISSQTLNQGYGKNREALDGETYLKMLTGVATKTQLC